MNKFLLFKYLFEKAEDCYDRKEFMIALQYLNEVIFLSFALPNNFISNAYELRGIVKINLNQHMGSIIDFNKAIHLYPKNSSLYFYRCLCYAVLSKYDDAIKDCKKLIELEPHESIHHHNLKFFENINK
tara:strand:- start:71 stop:457 length:387 start_codon:yes stop_codon:yes gene_type:complete